MNILAFPAPRANVVPLPAKPATVQIAELALAGNVHAFSWMMNHYAQSAGEVRLVMERAGLKDGYVSSDDPAMVGYITRMLLTMPGWVVHVHRAVRLLKPHNRHRLVNQLPYCIQQTADRNAWCLVNRGYKPICADVQFPYIRYESAGYAHISRAHFENLKRAGAVDDSGYFYRGDTAPATSACIAAYRRKVAALLAPWALL
jgi:hypothetical protein